MAKKKIDKPFFLTFVNLPIFGNEHEYDLYKDDHSRNRDHIKSLFEQVLKEGSLPPDHALRFKSALRTRVISSWDRLEDEHIKKIIAA